MQNPTMGVSFQLSEKFWNEYKNKESKWGPLGKLVYLRTYSRIKEDGSKETWPETVKRVVEGVYNIQKEYCDGLRLPWNAYKAQKSAQTMFIKIFHFKFLPPGRGLWMMGTNFIKEKGSAALQNCAFISTEEIATRGSFVFSWVMDALMLGVGVGFDTKGAKKAIIKEPKPRNGLVYKIEDSREGWVESIELLTDSFLFGKQLPKFEYNLIRPYGEPIKGFGGTASGPEPLIRLHKNVETLLRKRIGDYITSVDILDIMNMIGVCVVSGNVRRSAELALGSADDIEYREAKDFNKHPEEMKSHRWSSNNSIEAAVGKTRYEDFVENIAHNGEPGIVWLDNIRKFGRSEDGFDDSDRFAMGVNPCAEQVLESNELCCLVETFPSLHESKEEYFETLKYAYLYGKSVTLLPTHWPETNAVMMKNRRIGTSMSGIIDGFIKHGRRTLLNWSDEGYKYIRELDEKYSNWLAVPKSIRMTTIKPSGSVSLLPGVSPGIHYPHSKFYIRRVNVSKTSELYKAYKKAGYQVEDLVCGTEELRKNTAVICIPVKEEMFDKKKENATIWEQMKNAADMQRYWSDNSVSITVTFRPEEKSQLADVLYAFENDLKAVSFLPLTNESYEQAPYEEITEEEYEKMIKKQKPVDFSNVLEAPKGEKYCTNDSCTF